MKNIILFIAVLFSITMMSCTETIDFKVKNQDPILVVDGLITNEQKAHQVKIIFSSDVFSDDAAAGVEGAEVTISDGVITHILHDMGGGIYLTDDTVKGVIGKSYQLSIVYDGEEYDAVSDLKPLNPIKCASMMKGVDLDPNDLFIRNAYLIFMDADEPAGLGDYYLYNFYKNDTLVTDTLGDKIFYSDELVDGTSFRQLLIFFVDTNDVDINKDNLTLEMTSINKNYYDFLFAMRTMDFRGSPFDGPPANVPTNLSNGAMGFFNAMAVEKAEVCKIVNPYDKIFECEEGCFETILIALDFEGQCSRGELDCILCQMLGFVHPNAPC
jgi:hypothetical protein